MNEELVKSTVGTPPAASKRVKRKTKRPKAPAAAGPAVTVGGKTAAAPGPCCIGSGGFGFGSGYGGSNGIGGGVGGEFNVGTHTAKRAKTRARKSGLVMVLLAREGRGGGGVLKVQMNTSNKA